MCKKLICQYCDKDMMTLIMKANQYGIVSVGQKNENVIISIIIIIIILFLYIYSLRNPKNRSECLSILRWLVIAGLLLGASLVIVGIIVKVL